MKKPGIVRGAQPARQALGLAFDLIPKAVFAMAAYKLAIPSGVSDAEADAIAKRRLLQVWDELAPAGLPLPTPADRMVLSGSEVSGQGSVPPAS